MPREIILVLGLEPEGLLPSMELCRELTTVIRVTILIPFHLFPLVPDYLRQNPRVLIARIPSQDPPHDHHNQIENILSWRSRVSGRPVCAIIDVKMAWTAKIFHNVKVPTIAFINSRARWPATELATWSADPLNLNPVEVPFINREPEEIPVAYKQRPYGPPGGRGTRPQNHGAGHPVPQNHGAGHPGPVHGVGHPGLDPVWVELVERSIAVMINIYEDLEPQFIDNIANQLGKPVWAVGPLGGAFQHGFPARARATLDAFKKSILKKVD